MIIHFIRTIKKLCFYKTKKIRYLLNFSLEYRSVDFIFYCGDFFSNRITIGNINFCMNNI